MSESHVRKSYRVTCEEDLLKIPDLLTAREFCKNWGINCRGLRELKDAIPILVEHWRENERRSKEEVQKVCGIEVTNEFQQAIRDDHRKREKLVLKIDETLDMYKRLPRQLQHDLEKFIGDLVHKCEVRKHELMSPECTILIAGETGAGKSSFLNLLLETDVLPVSQLACTRTFCELHKSRDNRKTATCYFKATDGPGSEKSPMKIDLSTSEGLAQLGKEIARIDEETEMDESPYERIVIQYPFPLLEKGIVLVDTPGIGESKALIKHVSRYLEKSFGFIYVVNSSNAGGVHEGRLKDFLRTVTSSTVEDLQQYSTMFVCNKWETVPDKYKEEVRIDTMRKLQHFFPNITDDQLFFMSLEQARDHYSTLGKVSPEHHAMLSGMQRLLPATLENKLNVHYRFVSTILKRSLYSLKVAKNMVRCSKEEKEKLISNIKTRMQTIQCKAMRSVDDLRRGMEYEVNSLNETLKSVVNSEEFRRACSYWEPRECPGSKDKSKLIRDASELIENRVCMHVDAWEKKFRVIRTLKDKIISKLKRDCELMEDQIREIESTLIAGENVIIRNLHTTMKGDPRRKKLKNKKKDDKSGDTKVRSLGGAVSITGRFDSSKPVKKFFKDFKKKPPEVSMAEATNMYIQNILNSKELFTNIQNFLNRYVKGIDLVARKIPDFIASDQDMLEEIERQLQQSDEVMADIPGLIRKCSMLQGELDMIYVNDIMQKDYRLRDLEWSSDSKLGSGAFAEVYAAKLRQGDKSIDVALKWFKDSVKSQTVTDILLEDRTMREMKHRNLIRYYGCTLQVRNGKLHWIMILEFCKCTLRDQLIHDDYENPGKVDEALQLRPKLEMARYASQICQGLEFLHGKELVHRDLKLENVLLTKDDVVKLTDVGLSKPQDDISGTVAGSPVYMAPEIHLQKGIYGRKADIFSLGIMLWEMWYGEDAADHISNALSSLGCHPRDLGHQFEKGLRPEMYPRFKPDSEWYNVIVQCWALKPDNRPEAKHVRRFFDDFLHMNKPRK